MTTFNPTKYGAVKVNAIPSPSIPEEVANISSAKQQPSFLNRLDKFGLGLGVGLANIGENIIKAPVRLLPEKQEKAVFGALGLEKGQSAAQKMFPQASVPGEALGNVIGELGLMMLPIPGMSGVEKHIAKTPKIAKIALDLIKDGLEFGAKGYAASGGEPSSAISGAVGGVIGGAFGKILKGISTKLLAPQKFVPKKAPTIEPKIPQKSTQFAFPDKTSVYKGKEIQKPIIDLVSVKLPPKYGTKTAEQLAKESNVYDKDLNVVWEKLQPAIRQSDDKINQEASKFVEKIDISPITNALENQAKIAGEAKKGGGVFYSRAFNLQVLNPDGMEMNELIALRKLSDNLSKGNSTNPQEKAMFSLLANKTRDLIRKESPTIGKEFQKQSDLIILESRIGKRLQEIPKELASYMNKVNISKNVLETTQRQREIDAQSKVVKELFAYKDIVSNALLEAERQNNRNTEKLAQELSKMMEEKRLFQLKSGELFKSEKITLNALGILNNLRYVNQGLFKILKNNPDLEDYLRPIFPMLGIEATKVINREKARQ